MLNRVESVHIASNVSRGGGGGRSTKYFAGPCRPHLLLVLIAISAMQFDDSVENVMTTLSLKV